ncbi:CinA domain protein [Thermobaculum terrenum ATCC BAA-798]|uniref:CinA domain protein n=1 Tax=Thermobaculum terrenum (strain ATCC BAA-798 / CCMEE 7001 / YNP1) TaxID=525904 RepID=D1CDH1_THET1|nr:CinA family protein [Thermobaculum terrenum]ACZ40977.1 CinA domain protein [Thermobaculum terrenum ATCC BAA-798]
MANSISLAFQVYRMIGNLTLSVAESCTGGSLASSIVSIPGSSRFFLGGVVAYSNDIKIRILGVSERTISIHGAVSSACALEMANNVRKLMGADIALSTTGIAGPEGGTEEKPVGLVYVAISTPEGSWYIRRIWRGTRAQNIASTNAAALSLLIEYLAQKINPD